MRIAAAVATVVLGTLPAGCASTGAGAPSPEGESGVPTRDAPRTVIVEVRNNAVPLRQLRIVATTLDGHAVELGVIRPTETDAWYLEVEGAGRYVLRAIESWAAAESGIRSSRFQIRADTERVIWSLRSNFLRLVARDTTGA